jgi:tungstate transport system ATP-binding protein
VGLIVELKNVSKAFNGISALDNVNLGIGEGEIFALLGPSGSGKTSLLKIMALIENPTNGEVYYNGEKVTEKNMQQTRMQATMVFQKTVVFDTTVFKNITYGLRLRRMPESQIRKEVGEALRLVGLVGFEKRAAKNLSGGEQQRVALARALTLKTKLVLLDEPTANLDPRNASIIEDIIESVNRMSKTTFVMATHNIFQARTLPHRIALLQNGVIKETGTSAEVFSSLSRTLASFAVVDNTFVGYANPSANGTTIVDVGNGVQIEMTEMQTGKISVFVDPKEIIILIKKFTSSARNVLKGRITEIADAGNVAKVTVDVGKPFTVQITKRSLAEMKLNLGMEVYLAFKASSVQAI